MMGWRLWRWYWCRCAGCCFAIWVIREESSVDSAAPEDIEIGRKVAESFARSERKDVRACSWMKVVDR